MTNTSPNPQIRKFTKVLVYATLALIFIGGMVTSTGSGLSVPDWPLSYGTFFPPMVGGVFYEHGHRMVATVIGLLTLILVIWLLKSQEKKWVKNLSFYALGAVIAQGLLGGLTVLLFLPPPVSIGHGVLAQTFFVITIVIAYGLSLERQEREKKDFTKTSPAVLKLFLLFAVLIYIQLIIGAAMRHNHAGLAVPDFPTMGGSWCPMVTNDMMQNINAWRFDHNLDRVVKAQVIIHLVHRGIALLIFVLMMYISMVAVKELEKGSKAIKTFMQLNTVIFLQIILGISTVLSEKNPIVTSLHVMTGAATLGLAVLLVLRSAPLSWKKFTEDAF